jgi:hypothetical protein
MTSGDEQGTRPRPSPHGAPPANADFQARIWRSLAQAVAWAVALVVFILIGYVTSTYSPSGFWNATVSIGCLVSIVGLIGCVCVSFAWRQRHESVDRTGWHAAFVDPLYATVSTPDGQGGVMEFAVRYPGGGRLRLRKEESVYRRMSMIGLRNLPAWVGGDDNRMVVVVVGPEKTGRPHLVPAKRLGDLIFDDAPADRE